VGAYTFPTYALVIDWLIVAFALFWFPFLAIAQMMMNGGWEVSNSVDFFAKLLSLIVKYCTYNALHVAQKCR